MEYMCHYSIIPKAIISAIYHAIGDYFRCTNESVIITLNDGQIKGVKRETVYGLFYFCFEGIPFGKPPIGELRFRAPEPVEPWSGIWDCTRGYKVPLQKLFPTNYVKGYEDCLYLNVYTKKFNTPKPLPVLVFIPGGGFQLAESTRGLYGPDYLMEKDIVVVVINYRLGALGFLSLKDPALKIPGNAGLHDQILALRWIKNNIKHLNGDPNNITVAGQSAGALSAHYLMCFEQTRNLFHKAILMSGSILLEWSTFPQSNWAYRLACELGYKETNVDKDVLEFLLKIDAKKIHMATKNILTQAERRQFFLMNFGPTIEPYESENSLIIKSPTKMLKTAWGNQIPILFGNTSFEGLNFMAMLKKYPFLLDDLGDCATLLPFEHRKKCTQSEKKYISSEVKRRYFGNIQPNYKQHFYEFLDYMSYALILAGVYRNVPARLKYASNTSSYLYRFDFDSPDFNHCRQITCGTGMRGAAHTDDCSYIFHNFLAQKLIKSSAEFKTIERMVGMIAAFMETSNPNCKEIEPTVWKPLHDKKKVMCLNISDKIQMIELPEKSKYEFWSKVFPMIGEEF